MVKHSKKRMFARGGIRSVHKNSPHLPSLEELAEEWASQKGIKYVGKVRKLSNGAIGASFSVDGKTVFRIFKSGSVPNNAGKKYSHERITKKQAVHAFNAHYAKLAEEVGEEEAEKQKEHDMCTRSPRTNVSKYLRSPHKYDFYKLDDGEKCPKGTITPRKALTSEQRRSRLEHLAKYWEAKDPARADKIRAKIGGGEFDEEEEDDVVDVTGDLEPVSTPAPAPVPESD